MATLVSPLERAKKRPAQARSQATVAAILEATAHILAEGGYDALTTNHVAERAGVSIGSLYQYFPGKEALVGELLDQHCDHMNALFATVFMKSQALSPKQLAREIVAAIYLAKCDNPKLARVFREQLPRFGNLQRLEDMLQQITHVVAGYLSERKHLLRIDDVERAAFFAVELGESLATAAVVKRNQESAEDIIDEITDILVRYLFR